MLTSYFQSLALSIRLLCLGCFLYGTDTEVMRCLFFTFLRQVTHHCPPCSFLDLYDGADSTPEQRGQCPAGWQPTDDPRDFVGRGGVWDPGTDDLAEREMGGPPGGEHGEAVAVSGAQGTRTRLCDRIAQLSSGPVCGSCESDQDRAGLAMALPLSMGPVPGMFMTSVSSMTC